MKALDDAQEGESGEVKSAVVAFVHAEPRDEDKPGKQMAKLVKQVKWLAGKWNTRYTVLHSFELQASRWLESTGSFYSLGPAKKNNLHFY